MIYLYQSDIQYNWAFGNKTVWEYDFWSENFSAENDMTLHIYIIKMRELNDENDR